MPDLVPVMPLARRLAPRLDALNAAIRAAAARTDALLVDFAAHPVASDPRLWSPDRLHANAAGHARIAAALAHALGIPGADEDWRLPLPPAAPRSAALRLRDELVWGQDYLLPWLLRHSLGRSSGDRRQAEAPGARPGAPGAAAIISRFDRGRCPMVQSQASDVTAYLAELPPERRAVVAAVRDVVLANLPAGYREAVGWGMITWSIPLERYPDTYNQQPLCFAALAAQKNHYVALPDRRLPGPQARSRRCARRSRRPARSSTWASRASASSASRTCRWRRSAR